MTATGFAKCMGREQGFSLIELMTTLAVAAILLGIAVPSFHDLIQNWRLTTTVNDFFAAINLTRSEAMQRGMRVDLVPSEDDWSKGWVVFVDGNNNQKADPGERIIFTHGPVPEGMTVEAKLSDPKGKYLAYNGSGRTRTNANSEVPQFGSFLFKLDDKSRKVTINMLGRARVCTPDPGSNSC